MHRFVTDGLRLLAWLIMLGAAFVVWRSIPFDSMAENGGVAFACFILPTILIAGGLAIGLYKLADRLAHTYGPPQ